MAHILSFFDRQQLLLWSLIDGQAELKAQLNEEKAKEHAFDLIECLDDLLNDYETRVLDIVPVQLQLRRELVELQRISDSHVKIEEDWAIEVDSDSDSMCEKDGKSNEMAESGIGSPSAGSLIADLIDDDDNEPDGDADGGDKTVPLTKTKTVPPKKAKRQAPRPASDPFERNVFICNVCNNAYDRKNLLANHLKTHFTREFFNCNECHKPFHSENWLKRHMRIHEQKGPYACSLCSRTFVSEKGRRQHIKNGHNVDLERPSIPCPTCGKIFKTATELRRHERTHSNEHGYKCNVCHLVYRRERMLKTHMRSHIQREKPHVCIDCNKGFACSSLLKLHIAYRHPRVKPFKCTKCPKAYAKEYELKRHMLTHDRPPQEFMCEMCGRQFPRANCLASHLRAHANRLRATQF